MNFASKTVPRVQKLTSWSYSRYGDWKKCPLATKLKHLDKIREPSSPAMTRGTEIHTHAEHYIKGLEPKLHPDLAKFAAEFKALKAAYKKKALPMVVEDNWAFTKTWGETQWNNWTECWLRIKLDCAHYVAQDHMVVTDWKTGKFNDVKAEEYMEQLELYALTAMLLHDFLNKVQVRLGFTDYGIMYPAEPLVYTRADLPRLKKLWEQRVKPMMSDTKFVPKPNDSCRWCFYGQAGKAKGGPGICKF